MTEENSEEIYLLKLLNNEIDNQYSDQTKVLLYLTLLSLNNNNYKEEIHLKEHNTIDNYLRKINNLKVKIQLKRKPEEIDNLLEEIKELSKINEKLISKYNKNNLDIINTLDSKDPTKITPLVDSLTKEKITRQNKKEYYNKLRQEIIKEIYHTTYHIIDNTLYIGSDITISLDEFYEMFDYLLDSNNYNDPFINKEANNLHRNIINNVIESFSNPQKISEEIIPIVATAILTKQLLDYENIDMSHFNIDNIKITDLYGFAYESSSINSENTAKWKKITIPNNYLYQKIKEMVSSGMYYCKDNKFILEIVNDFKTSISTSDMYKFLKDNIKNIYNVNINKKHI